MTKNNDWGMEMSRASADPTYQSWSAAGQAASSTMKVVNDSLAVPSLTGALKPKPAEYRFADSPDDTKAPFAWGWIIALTILIAMFGGGAGP